MNCLSFCGLRAVLAVLFAALTMALAAAQPAPPKLNPPMPVPAEPPVPPAEAKPLGGPMAVPGFWDPRRRPERPDLTRINIIRFLTETDYPPFNYAGPDGNPTGFNVELARAICHEINVACTIQMRRFDTLVEALNKNEGDAVIASLAETPAMRQKVDFSHPYYRTPARFVARRDLKGLKVITPAALEGR